MRLSWSQRAAFAVALALMSGSTEAATLTCQDRSVNAIAVWGGVQGDSVRADDYGVFDRSAHAYWQGSYPYYTSSTAGASQVSQVSGDTIQATCTAESQFVTYSDQRGSANAVSHLEFCFRLDRPTLITIVAKASGQSWSDASATSLVAFAGPNGLRLGLLRYCTSGICSQDSLLSITLPIYAGEYTLEAEANATAAGSASFGNWLATTSLDVLIRLSESLLPVTETTWGSVKNLYRDVAR